ncbi:MAG: DUF3472 domain-containing protein [Candidatus Kapaibacterium sp.]|nr:MAG: DUF3472 domain-containing protein [Candidatus Kapabacteria bacterium]
MIQTNILSFHTVFSETFMQTSKNVCAMPVAANTNFSVVAWLWSIVVLLDFVGTLESAHAQTSSASGITHDANKVTVPVGGNAWITSSSGNTRITNDGLVNWNNPNDRCTVYVRLAQPGTLKLSLQFASSNFQRRIRVGVRGTFREMQTAALPVGGSAAGSGASENFVGAWSISQAGYVPIIIHGISSSTGTFGILSGVALSGTALTPDATFVRNNNDNYFLWGRRGPSVHAWYTVPQAAHSATTVFYNEVTVPANNDVIGSFFMANGFAEGYFGMQVNSATERRILFSVWSGFQTDNPALIPADQKVLLLKKGANVVTNEFGNEGSGGQSFLRYNWRAGTTYKFMTQAQQTSDNGTIYSAYFFAPEVNSWQLIAVFKRQKISTTLKGLHSFVENFVPETGNIQRMAQFGNQWIMDNAGNWTELRQMQFTTDLTGQKNYRRDYAGGVAGGSFVLRNCGFFNDSTRYGTTFTRTTTNTAPLNTSSWWLVASLGVRAPGLSSLNTMEIPGGTTTTAVITLRDDNPETVRFTVQSSNGTLLPVQNVVISGSGSQRTLRISPVRGQFGETTITITATDDTGLATTMRFVLRVSNIPIVVPEFTTTATMLANAIASWQFRNPQFPESFGAFKKFHGAYPNGQGTADGKDYYAVMGYDANVGLRGFLRSQHPERLQRVRDWLNWYIDHVDSNGILLDHFYNEQGGGETTVVKMKNANDQARFSNFADSHDSYAATTLGLAYEYLLFSGDQAWFNSTTPNKRRNVRDYLNRIGRLLTDRLIQADGLAWAKDPEWRVKYTMDNAEVFWGLQAMSLLQSSVYAQSTEATRYARASQRLQDAMRRLMVNSQTGLYAIAMHGTSAPEQAKMIISTWYPDALAQIWPQLWGLETPAAPISILARTRVNQVWANWQTTNFPALGVGLAYTLAGDTARGRTHARNAIARYLPQMQWDFVIREAGLLLANILPNNAGLRQWHIPQSDLAPALSALSSAKSQAATASASASASANANDWSGFASTTDVAATQADTRLSAYPNPVQTDFTLRYGLTKSDAVRVELLGLDGRVVATLWNGQQAAGEQRITASVENLASGAYMCRVVTSAGVQMVNANVVR